MKLLAFSLSSREDRFVQLSRQRITECLTPFQFIRHDIASINHILCECVDRRSQTLRFIRSVVFNLEQLGELVLLLRGIQILTPSIVINGRHGLENEIERVAPLLESNSEKFTDLFIVTP